MTLWLWVGFVGLLIGMLAVDLGAFNRDRHLIPIREALAWTVFWFAVAFAFNIGIFYLYKYDFLGIVPANTEDITGGKAAIEFLTAFLIEKSLSIDNIFWIALIFG